MEVGSAETTDTVLFFIEVGRCLSFATDTNTFLSPPMTATTLRMETVWHLWGEKTGVISKGDRLDAKGSEKMKIEWCGTRLMPFHNYARIDGALCSHLALGNHRDQDKDTSCRLSLYPAIEYSKSF
jgi:hypothetical protein